MVACRRQFILVPGGEGSGKSAAAAKHLLGRWPDDMVKHEGRGMGDGEPNLYWLVGADYAQVTEEFRYLERDLTELYGNAVKATLRVDPGHIEVVVPGEKRPRLRIETKSAGDAAKISRARPDGIVMCEAGQIDYVIFERCYGRAQQGDGWLMGAGTLEGSVGWYPQLITAWSTGAGKGIALKLPTWSNRTLFPGGRNDPKIKEIEATHTDEYFMQRIAGEVVPPKGLVVPEFRADLHVVDLEYGNPDLPVFLWEDPGYGARSAHAILAVRVDHGQVQVIDEIYERNLLTDQLIQVCQRRPWWQKVSQIVTDPHYKDQHHAVHSVSDVWIRETGLVPQGEYGRLLPGIERLRGYFLPDPISGRPGIVIDPRCRGLLSELGAGVDPFDGKSFHPWVWKQTREGALAGEEPLDEYNHSAKSLIYGIVFNFGYSKALDRDIFLTRTSRERAKQPATEAPAPYHDTGFATRTGGNQTLKDHFFSR